MQNPDVLVHADKRHLIRDCGQRTLDEIMLQRDVPVVKDDYQRPVRMRRPLLQMQFTVVRVCLSCGDAGHVQSQVAVKIEIALVNIEKSEAGLRCHARAVVGI